MSSRRRRIGITIAVVVAWTVALPPVHAGGSAETIVGVQRYGEVPIRELALRVNDELDRRKANVALIARAGKLRSDLPKGVRYTHVAFAVFEPVRGADGAVFYTYATYNLYQGHNGRMDRSYLKQDLTYDIVAGIAEPEVAVCIPTDELQRRLVAVIRSPAYAGLHIPDYNIVANPWVDRFDNCVTHTLKICVAAIYQTTDRARIYRNIRAHFRPTPIRLGLIKSLGAGGVEGFSWDDMDPSGLHTGTYDSLNAFLEENGLVKESFVVRLDSNFVAQR